MPKQSHLAVVAVWQEHHQAGLPQPLGLPTGDELVKHHLQDRSMQSDRLRWWLCSELSRQASVTTAVPNMAFAASCAMGCAGELTSISPGSFTPNQWAD